MGCGAPQGRSVPAALGGFDTLNVREGTAIRSRERNIGFTVEDAAGIAENRDRPVGFEAVAGPVINGISAMPKLAAGP